MKELLELFTIFFKIGGFTFGGGYAMIPIMQKEIVDNRGWATNEEILDYFAIGQCTPGVIAVNTATFIGYKRKGALGGIFATLGLVSPSLLIISIISKFMEQFQTYEVVQHAFRGIQVVVVALILNVAIDMAKQTIKDKLGIVICILAFLVIAVLRISPIIVVLISGVVGALKYGRKESPNSASETEEIE